MADSTPGTASQQVAAQSESHPVADSTVPGFDQWYDSGFTYELN